MPDRSRVEVTQATELTVKIPRGAQSKDLIEKIKAALEPLSTDMQEADEAIVVVSRIGKMPKPTKRPKPPKPPKPKK